MTHEPLERLRVSRDGRRLETASGRPFFYLADTAWTLPQRLKWDDADYFMQRRREQGFTVLQIVALDPERDEQMRDPAGHPALIDGDLSRPNELYFRYLDRVLDRAEELGFYVLLLPVWGQLVVGESWGGKTFPRTVTKENAYAFGEWIGERYRGRTNLIWCLGGDRQPIHNGTDYCDVWRRLAEGIGHGVTGEDCRWNVPSAAWDRLLLTYHTCFEVETGEFSTMSYWTDEEAWISFIALQSGHGRETRSYAVVRKEYERERILPVLDAEPAYERMPMNWPQLFPLHDDWIVRMRAYWNLLAGAFGHTYGHASVWCMISEKERNEVLSTSWFEALSHPGAGQMAILRGFVEAMDVSDWVPAQGVLAHDTTCAEDCVDHHRQAAIGRDGQFLIVYFTDGGSETVDLAALAPGIEYRGAWFDPRTGQLDGEPFPVSVRTSPEASGTVFTAPTTGPACDWLLVITSRAEQLGRLGRPRTWGETAEVPAMSMIWAE
ncbi:apiosidase-like domain-containing protein [Humibacter sp.]|uniref:apiosidase-like domain-containing protein n=1 Tax=Humibacter sp. TaxID=1940291 RepID=UPI003F7E1D47